MLARLFTILLIAAPLTAAADEFRLEARSIENLKSVFATIESENVVPARARIGGTVAALHVDEGDQVGAGAVIATIGDEKLVLRRNSLDAQIAAAQAEFEQAETDLSRTRTLFERGTVAQARLDQARTASNVAGNRLKSLQAERSVIDQQLSEGDVLAPGAGRVLSVPVRPGTVVLPGDTIARIADENYVLRLRVPERHARFLRIGDTVRLGGAELGDGLAREGRITLVYPQIEDGRVVADASVEGIGGFFVGERVRVWISVGERSALVVPSRFISTRYGADYVSLRRPDGTLAEIPVQRGVAVPLPDIENAIEILTGLNAGDVLVAP